MAFSINYATKEKPGDHNYSLEQLGEIIDIDPGTARQLRDVTIKQNLWDIIGSERFLLLPYTGMSVEEIDQLKYEHNERHEDDNVKKRERKKEQAGTEEEKFVDIASAHFDQPFYKGHHKPAWIALSLGIQPPEECNGSVRIEQLNCAHLLSAALVTAQLSTVPLRGIFEDSRSKNKTVREQVIHYDSTGKAFPQYIKNEFRPGEDMLDAQGKRVPLTRDRSVTNYENIYLRSSDYSGAYSSDWVIVGSTIGSGTVLTRRDTFTGGERIAKGIVIPVGNTHQQ